jgi:cytoskeletal protein CcmA (bactofilin family)
MGKYNNESAPTDFNRIVAGTVLKGELSTENDIRIDGTLVGNAHVKGKVVLGPNGRIEGDLVCKNAEIQGNIKANIKVEELLSLKSSAVVQGEVITNKIAIEPGAKISGTINMDKQMSHLKVDKADAKKSEAAS